MIKGDLQISEPATNMPPMQLHRELDTNFSTNEPKINNLMVEKDKEKLEVKNHFSRLKRRMRGSSSGIF